MLAVLPTAFSGVRYAIKHLVEARNQKVSLVRATRRQGLWAGNVPPLGYAVRNQHLLVNEGEAQVVRALFQRFLELRSMTALAKELQDKGITTKAWINPNGQGARWSATRLIR